MQRERTISTGDMVDGVIRTLGSGLSQRGVRDHNARLLLTLIQRHGGMPASDLARLAGLSPPTVSTILKRLENEGFVLRGDPVRGKVGKPSTPMLLDPDGAFSFGLKIGRRSCEIAIIDFSGKLRDERQIAYQRPIPADVFRFVQESIQDITAEMTPEEVRRICGLGVAAAFEIWNWPIENTHTQPEFTEWRSVNLRDDLHELTGLPVSLLNDATAACQAEHIYGRGREFQDYAYFFIGAYIGGGIVLDNAVFEGRRGNAGALGSLRSIGPNGESMQLVDTASIRQLEQRLNEVDIDPRRLWTDPDSWPALTRYVDPWLGQTAQEISKAALSVCSVIDFEAILIDGAFPPSIRSELVKRVRRYVATQDRRGLIKPKIEAGSIGAKARAIGAATRPIDQQFML